MLEKSILVTVNVAFLSVAILMVLVGFGISQDPLIAHITGIVGVGYALACLGFAVGLGICASVAKIFFPGEAGFVVKFQPQFYGALVAGEYQAVERKFLGGMSVSFQGSPVPMIFSGMALIFIISALVLMMPFVLGF